MGRLRGFIFLFLSSWSLARRIFIISLFLRLLLFWCIGVSIGRGRFSFLLLLLYLLILLIQGYILRRWTRAAFLWFIFFRFLMHICLLMFFSWLVYLLLCYGRFRLRSSIFLESSFNNYTALLQSIPISFWMTSTILTMLLSFLHRRKRRFSSATFLGRLGFLFISMPIIFIRVIKWVIINIAMTFLITIVFLLSSATSCQAR